MSTAHLLTNLVKAVGSQLRTGAGVGGGSQGEGLGICDTSVPRGPLSTHPTDNFASRAGPVGC